MIELTCATVQQELVLQDGIRGREVFGVFLMLDLLFSVPWIFAIHQSSLRCLINSINSSSGIRAVKRLESPSIACRFKV